MLEQVLLQARYSNLFLRARGRQDHHRKGLFLDPEVSIWLRFQSMFLQLI